MYREDADGIWRPFGLWTESMENKISDEEMSSIRVGLAICNERDYLIK